MDDLLSWLREQLDDDEWVARHGRSCDVAHPQADMYHPDGHPHARALAEVEAKRAILDQVGSRGELADLDVESTAWLLGTLAQPYRDRPGWKPEWAASS